MALKDFLLFRIPSGTVNLMTLLTISKTIGSFILFQKSRDEDWNNYWFVIYKSSLIFWKKPKHQGLEKKILGHFDLLQEALGVRIITDQQGSLISLSLKSGITIHLRHPVDTGQTTVWFKAIRAFMPDSLEV